MKVLGQGVKDLTERFFHGMYVSAQGNPLYTNNPTDGTVIDSGLMQIGVPAFSIFLAFIFIAVLSLLAMYYIQQHRVLGISSTAVS